MDPLKITQLAPLLQKLKIGIAFATCTSFVIEVSFEYSTRTYEFKLNRIMPKNAE